MSEEIGHNDWLDAPEWANWLAMDSDGWWYWFAMEPEWEDGVWHTHHEDGFDPALACDMPDESGIDWDFAHSTKEPRP